jgi:hypothetical protein
MNSTRLIWMRRWSRCAASDLSESYELYCELDRLRSIPLCQVVEDRDF